MDYPNYNQLLLTIITSCYSPVVVNHYNHYILLTIRIDPLAVVQHSNDRPPAGPSAWQWRVEAPEAACVTQGVVPERAGSGTASSVWVGFGLAKIS